MLLAGIAPEEIAETLGISVVGLEPRLWETVRALGRLDATRGPHSAIGSGRPSLPDRLAADGFSGGVDRGRPDRCRRAITPT